MYKPLFRGVTLSAALVTSAAVLAQAPVYDVDTSSQQQSSSAASSSSAPGSLEQRIAVLERMVDSRTQMQHRLQQQLNTMQGEIDDLRGAVEVHTNQLEKVLERQRELYLEIDKRVEALKQGGYSAGSDSSGASNNISNSPSKAKSSSDNANEEDVYNAAVNLILETREYDKAIPAFQAFLSQFPDGEYAPNAHFWLGQLLFNEQQWARASEQFNIVIDRFSDSSKTPEAVLKLGVIAQRQGNIEQARERFQQVLNEYPNSSVSKLAESRLQSL